MPRAVACSHVLAPLLALVSAPFAAGRALFDDPSVPQPIRRFDVTGPQSFASFGGHDQVALTDDLDGDGICDIAIGADRFDIDAAGGPLIDGGAAFLYSGADGLPLLRADGQPAMIVGDEANDRFGAVVRWLPDLDGDGVGELAVSAPSFGATDRIGPDSHAQYVRVFSGATLLGTPRYCQIDPPATQGREGNFGMSMAPAGNVDDDGTPELLIGSGGGFNVAYLYSGASLGASLLAGRPHDANPVWKSTRTAHDVDGVAVSGFGDLNGDGYDEFVVGEYFFSDHPATPDEGRILVRRWAPAGDSRLGSALTTLEGEVIEAALGFSLHAPGDLDSVPGGELLVGAPGGNHRNISDVTRGRVLVFSGVLGNDGRLVLLGELEGELGELFGGGFAAGDFDGDGGRDLVVSARYHSTSELPYCGALRSWSLAPDGSGQLAFSPTWTILGKATGDKIGISSDARDGDGDGRAELLVGSGHLEADLDGDGDVDPQVGGATRLNHGVLAAHQWYGDAPVPGASGLPPELTLDGEPIPGSTITLAVTNTARTLSGAPAAADAMLFVGSQLAEHPATEFLVVDWEPLPFAFSAGEERFLLTDEIPADPALHGLRWCAQAYQVDVAAPRKLSASRAIELIFGLSGAPW
jgi:hypothetical protein